MRINSPRPSLKPAECAALRAHREQKKAVALMRESIREARASVDGVCSTAGERIKNKSYEERVADIDQLERVLKSQEKALARMREKAERAVSKLTRGYYIFATLYYIDALDMQQVQDMMGKSRRTAYYCKKFIEDCEKEKRNPP